MKTIGHICSGGSGKGTLMAVLLCARVTLNTWPGAASCCVSLHRGLLSVLCHHTGSLSAYSFLLLEAVLGGFPRDIWH